MDNNTEFVPPLMNGPETAPLPKFVKRYLVKVIIYNIEDQPIKEVVLDYGDPEQRRYLGKLSFWAWSEGHAVETMANV